MTGGYPVVGFMIFLDKMPVFETQQRVLNSLDPLITEESWSHSDLTESPRSVVFGRTIYGTARLGAVHLQAQMFTLEGADSNIVFLSFDEDEVVHVARQSALTITELLSPYIAVMETITGSKAVAVGFEMSPPSATDDRSLRSAGIALFFVRDSENKKWVRKEFLPMVGHYL